MWLQRIQAIVFHRRRRSAPRPPAARADRVSTNAHASRNGTFAGRSICVVMSALGGEAEEFNPTLGEVWAM